MSSKTVKCGHCGIQGHNRRTCSMRNVTIRRKVNKIKKIKKIILRKKPAPAPAKPVVETCSICFDDCKGKTCTLECGHTFHTKCIFTWFNKNNNCPLCRAEVKELKPQALWKQRMELPPYGFLRIIFDMTDSQLAENPPPPELGEMDNRAYDMASIGMMTDIINQLSAEEYQRYSDRAREGEERYASV